MTQKKIGVVLAGCGFLDGAAIQEATLTLLALDQRDAKVVAMAPNIEQMHVVDHMIASPVADESRNVLTESARVVRGKIQDISSVDANDLDALIVPGGFGVAKNLSSFATEGVEMKINAEVEALVHDMADAKKPMGFICIAPAIAAKVLGENGVTLTLGDGEEIASAVQSFGAKHVNAAVEEIVVDETNQVVSTPAYMYGEARIADVHRGIDALVDKVLAMLD